MQGQPTDFWGKLSSDPGIGGCPTWHPLQDHCADVAAVTEALLALPSWNDRLTRLAGHGLRQGENTRLCVLSALHDIGKFNIGFQSKGRSDLGRLRAGHVREALAALDHGGVFSCLDGLAGWGDGASGLLLAALCHHGRPYAINALAGAWQESWWRRTGDLDPRQGASDLLSRCRCWFPEAFSPGTAELPDRPTLAHAFSGLVTLADWIASDTRFFEYSGNSDQDRMPYAREAARRAVRAVGLDIPTPERADSSGRGAFARVSGYQPRAAQRAVLDVPLDGASVVVLEAETGSGKTEAALARFVALFEAGLVDGLYFALPTRTAAIQIHRRVRLGVQRAFASPPPVVLAVPGYLSVDESSGVRLPGFEVRWSDEERFRFRGWAAESAKRYLAGPIVVGTIDQVLLSSLMVRHSHLRATSLLRHLLVVDEVHASDAYMTQILRHVLARHVAAGGHSLLLSATLGAETRASLVDPAARHRSGTSLTEALDAPYPGLTYRGSHAAVRGILSDGRERRVAVTGRSLMSDSDAIARCAFDAARRGAKALVIRNTVADCLATQRSLERLAAAEGGEDVLFRCCGVAAPHHSRFARADREALDAALEAQLGKTRTLGGCVVVATQTVQQSLDLDADVLFSDLCPADVVLQRMGRLHRHERDANERPTGFRQAALIVLVPERRDLGILIGRDGTPHNFHGLGSVYEDLRILEATWRLIEGTPVWCVPSMSRYLVEHSLHSAVLQEIVIQHGSLWQDHANWVIGRTSGQRRLADLNLVDWSRPYGEFSFPERDEGRIATRLGEGDRRVQFTPAVSGPFGHVVPELVLPARWVSGVDGDMPDATNVAAREGMVTFSFGDRRFVYDRLGVRPDSQAAAGREVSEDDGP